MTSLHFRDPSRFVAGTVGLPGERTFFLQARDGRRLVSVSLEKQQVALLGRRTAELLDEVAASTGVSTHDEGPVDNGPLESPTDEEFRAGTMALSWDPVLERVVIEVLPIDDPDGDSHDDTDANDDEYPENALIVWLPAAQARGFAQRAIRVVEAGRPACPFCGGPIDVEGHLCPRANGFRRRDP